MLSIMINVDSQFSADFFAMGRISDNLKLDRQSVFRKQKIKTGIFSRMAWYVFFRNNISNPRSHHGME